MGTMSGYTDATEWLSENAPNWWLKESQANWDYLGYSGRRARIVYRVQLAPVDGPAEGPILYGEGHTIREAAKVALGMAREEGET